MSKYRKKLREELVKALSNDPPVPMRFTILSAWDEMERALEDITRMDHRGNKPMEQMKADNAFITIDGMVARHWR